MGSCLEEINHKKLKKGPWTAEEDEKLVNFISKNGYGNWRTLPRRAGLERGGKSCRLRWANYLRPDIKRGNFSPEEEHTIIKLHQLHGNKWSRIATHLPGRTDNEIKNYWNTHIRKKFLQMGMDPKTHKPRTDLSHLLSLCHQLLYCLQHFNNVLLMTNPNSLRLQPGGGNDDDDHDHADQTAAQMLPTQLLQNQLLHNILTTTKSLAPNFPEPFLESHHQNPNVNMSSVTPEAIHDPLFSAAAHPPTDHDNDNVNGVLCEYSPNFDQVNIDNYGQNMPNHFGGPPENQIPAMQPPEGFSDNQIIQSKTTGVALFDGAWQNLMDEDDETCCSYTGNMLWA